MEKIKIIVGDWSHDGHGMTDVFNVAVNCDKDKIWRFYHEGARIIGFDLCEEVCCEYDDSKIDGELFLQLLRSGYKCESLYDLDEFEEDDDLEEIFGDDLYIDTDIFVEMFMFFVEKGLKETNGQNLIWEYVDSDTPEYKIGGYGLFSL